jgi:hypothetical protein
MLLSLTFLILLDMLEVGLGDYYLQPQGLYVSDVFSWASRFLTGFVLVSTFLGKVGELVISQFPSKTESFGEFLRRTDGCTGKVIELPQSRTLIKLKEVVEDEKAAREGNLPIPGDMTRCAFEEHNLANLIEQKIILIQILHSTQAEIDSLLSKCANTQLSVLLTQMSDMKNNEAILEKVLHQSKKLRSELETMQIEGGVKALEKATE